MTSIIEAIRHYQRHIDRSMRNETILLHCIGKLNKLPTIVQNFQETGVRRTINNLRKYDGKVGQAASALIAKWKKEVDADIDESSVGREHLHKDDTENIEHSTVNRCTGSDINSTPNSDLVSCASDNNNISSHLEKSEEKSGPSERKSSKHRDGERSKSHHSRSSISQSNDKRKNNSTVSSHPREKRKKTKRRDCEKTIDKQRKHGSDIIDIDYTMGTSFAEALGMLDMPSTSKARKLSTEKSSTSNASSSSKHKRPSKRTSFDETPILLTKRPKLEPSLDIAVELLSPSTITNSEAKSLKCAFRLPREQTTQMTDAETISYSITSRSAKTKVFSGNKAESKCKVATLFEMCIRILQDNIDLLEFIGGVPFDILRPVLERATCEQLMTLEDYNPCLMEDTHCLWEQHCKRRFRSKSREELETWRDMYIRCFDEEQIKLNILTATIKLSRERQTKPAYVDTNAPRNTKAKDLKGSALRVASTVVDDRLQTAAKLKDSIQIRKRSKKSNDDPDWTPTTWYKTLYKKPSEPKPPKPPKPPIKRTIDMLRYDRAKALEQKKEEWKKRRR